MATTSIGRGSGFLSHLGPFFVFFMHNGLKYHFTIRQNSTGQTIREPGWCEWQEHTEFFLTTGNLGCDCNRDMLWRRAKDLPEDDSTRCLGRGQYTITEIEFENGEKIDDIEW